jgi:putative membrane protein
MGMTGSKQVEPWPVALEPVVPENSKKFLRIWGTDFFDTHPMHIRCRRHLASGNSKKETTMFTRLVTAAALATSLSTAVFAADGPSDPQIAHIAYTAGEIDIAAAKQALEKSKNAEVRDFAETMERDHKAVNEKALALVKKLKVTPEDNATSKSLESAAKTEMKTLSKLKGKAFDKAYVDNEVAYHKQVNGALETLLIPSAQNPELKSLLQTGLALFKEHQMHAEHLASMMK